MADKTVYIRVSAEVHKELEITAAMQDRPISYIVARMIEATIANAKTSQKKRKT